MAMGMIVLSFSMQPSRFHHDLYSSGVKPGNFLKKATPPQFILAIQKNQKTENCNQSQQ
jgi:hypothetical protein